MANNPENSDFASVSWAEKAGTNRGGLEAMSRGGANFARKIFFCPPLEFFCPPLEKILGGGKIILGGANYFSLIYGGNFRSGG